MVLFTILNSTLFFPVFAMSDISSGQVTIQEELKKFKRIPTTDGWFEVIKLPNNIYAFYEPGHIENVNSFLIIGESRDLLYDTGMGIASIKQAIYEVRESKGLPKHELIVFNSHGHLDHIGGNHEFDLVYALDDDWRIEKITKGIPAGQDIWMEYYKALTPLPNPPAHFSAETMLVRPIDESNIRYIRENDVFDLGDRQFKVIVSRSHTTDSVILYDTKNKLLFTGDVFVPSAFYVMDMIEFHKDLKMLSNLDVAFHYNTHGQQLLNLKVRTKALEALEKIKRENLAPEIVNFLGKDRQVYSVGKFRFWLMPDFLMY